MNTNRFGVVISSVILALFIAFYFYIAYLLSPSLISVGKGVVGVLLVCLMAFGVLYVINQMDGSETYVYPAFIAGLFYCLTPMLKDASMPYKGTAITVSPEWWGASAFHYSVIFAIIIIGYGMVFLARRGQRYR